jgi:PAS domain S-box-containing protein
MNTPNLFFFKSIKFKTFFVMSLFIGILFVVTAVVAKMYIASQFQKIENQKVSDNLERVVDTYNLELDNLSVKLSDWSRWDDTYQFIDDNNPAYIQSNLQLLTLQGLGINYIIFINNDSQVVGEYGLDLKTQEPMDVPRDLGDLIASGSALIKHDNVDSSITGALNLRNGYLMFASRPITKSNKESPMRGSVIFGKYLYDDQVKKLSEVSNLQIEVVPIDTNISGIDKTAYDSIQGGNKYYLNPIDKNTIQGYTLINDFFGKPAFMFKIVYPRDITIGGNNTINYFLILFSVSSILSLVIVLTYIDKFLVSKITRLASDVHVGTNITLYNSGDEISILAKKIDEAFRKRNEAEGRFETFMSNTPSIVWMKETTTWTHVYINKAFENFFKRSLEDIKAKTDFDIWPKETAEVLRKNDIETFTQKKTVRVYEDIPDPNGVTHNFLVYKFPLNLGDEVFIGGVAIDITDIKTTQTELEKSNRLMVDRELKMIELKKEIEGLKSNTH